MNDAKGNQSLTGEALRGSLRLGARDPWPEIDERTNKLLAAGSLDEATGNAMDRLIDAWRVETQERVKVNGAALLAQFERVRADAAAQVQNADHDLALAEQRLKEAAAKLTSFQDLAVLDPWKLNPGDSNGSRA